MAARARKHAPSVRACTRRPASPAAWTPSPVAHAAKDAACTGAAGQRLFKEFMENAMPNISTWYTYLRRNAARLRTGVSLRRGFNCSSTGTPSSSVFPADRQTPAAWAGA